MTKLKLETLGPLEPLEALYRRTPIVIDTRSDAAIAADLKDSLRKALEVCCRIHDEAKKAGIMLQAQTAYVEAIGRHAVVVLNAYKVIG